MYLSYLHTNRFLAEMTCQIYLRVYANNWCFTEYLHLHFIINWGFLAHKLKLLLPSWISVTLYVLHP